ncbi:hypothetical protein WJX73_008620 [Symbiochloris irregularis]|uniref:Uncharacterized protein n=1 Tax=Symbiochloris irregularis TaxID=706552 RepID=A0AAW1PVJ5_9CHLO
MLQLANRVEHCQIFWIARRSGAFTTFAGIALAPGEEQQSTTKSARATGEEYHLTTLTLMSSTIAKEIEREQRLEKEGLNNPEDSRPDPNSLGDVHLGTVINAGQPQPADKKFQGTSQEAPQAKYAKPMNKHDEDTLLSSGSKFTGDKAGGPYQGKSNAPYSKDK